MLKAVLYLLTAFFSGSHQQCFRDDDRVRSVKPEHFNYWVESGHRFSISLFQYLNRERITPNVLFSPSSMQESLLLAYFGAEGETEESLANVLQIPVGQEKPLTWEFYSKQRALNFGLQALSYPLKTANKLFLSNHLYLRSCMQDKFHYELEFIDYQTDVEWARKYINDWVANQTEGQITEHIRDLSPYSTGTLVNAVFYKGEWRTHFNSYFSQYILFRVNVNEWRSTMMMRRRGIFQHGYSEVLGARTLLLPYIGNSTAMIVLLPDVDLDTTIQSLNAFSLRFISDRINYHSAHFTFVFPKYKHKSRMHLNTILENLGVGDAFTECADFSGFTGRKEVFFSGIVQEAAIQVDEEGTTASASKGAVHKSFVRTSRDFLCDRPFAYIIYDFFARKVLFMGAFREP